MPGVGGSAPRLPSFPTDRLDPRWGQTDVVLQLCADAPTTLAHARRVLVRTARPLARPVWRQDGFTQPDRSGPGDGTPRNLMGQVDGTANPRPGDPDFDELIWIPGPGPLGGGTQLVFRRIAMLLDTWERVGRVERERVVGRRLADGAPLTGGEPAAPLRLAARDGHGRLVIPHDAHVRRAHPATPQERFLRRGYSYDDGHGAGLLFVCYQADIERQFVPVQRRLAELDALNRWTRAVGSATYTVLPGCRPGGHLGDTLPLDA